jgi:hypothetical protein
LTIGVEPTVADASAPILVLAAAPIGSSPAISSNYPTKVSRLKKAVRAATAAAVLAVVAAGCAPFSSPSEADRVRSTVRTVLTSNDPAICDRMFTLRFLEAASGRRGAQALESCRVRQPRAASTASSVSFIGVTVDGGHALAKIRVRGGSLDGRTATAGLIQDNGWKLDGLHASAPPPSAREVRAITDRALRQALSRLPGLSRKSASCVVAYLRRVASNAQLADDLTELKAGRNPADFAAAIRGCKK